MLPPIAILAGGLGTRLGDSAGGRPKSLVDVNGRPFIFFVLERVAEAGITDVVICTGYGAMQFADLIDNGSQFGLNISYSYDGVSQLGTGGALKKALPLLGSQFLVQYGDTLLDLDYALLWSKFIDAGKPVMMSVFRNDNRLDKSNVVFEHDRVKEYNKKKRHPSMRYIDYGAMVFNASVFNDEPTNVNFDLADMLCSLASQGNVAGMEVTKEFLEIGNPASLERVRKKLG